MYPVRSISTFNNNNKILALKYKHIVSYKKQKTIEDNIYNK